MVQDKDANLNAGDSWDKLIKGCPLNPLPEKRGSHNTEYDDGYTDGCFEGEREYGLNSCGSIKTPSSFTREMNWFCGMIFTIKNVRSGIFRVTYDLETNNKELNDEIKHYYWDEEMLTSAGLLAQIIQRRKTHV